MDRIIGTNGIGAIVTILECKSRSCLIKKRASKSTTDVTVATINLLILDKKHVHTIIANNAREFTHDAKIAKALNVKIYFAHPYSS
ncbi:hypothetical protein [Candidatus Enterovibrio escicola]|uniref:hypothetical protein n=1 Tax=Candidatus Enterovibrio escicola TaxID=1927127 RepID=UPI001237DA33|nr:hypothetical protein [Candidatus Enterovibrio escacola]